MSVNATPSLSRGFAGSRTLSVLEQNQNGHAVREISLPGTRVRLTYDPCPFSSGPPVEARTECEIPSELINHHPIG